MPHAESKLHRLDGPDPVHQAVTLAHAFCAAHDLSLEGRARLAILVEELIINLHDHGGLAADDIAEMGLWREGGFVHLMILDRGMPFDPRIAPSDRAVPDRGGGAGLALLTAWAEIIDYRTVEGANRLELRMAG